MALSISFEMSVAPLACIFLHGKSSHIFLRCCDMARLCEPQSRGGVLRKLLFYYSQYGVEKKREWTLDLSRAAVVEHRCQFAVEQAIE